MDSVNRMEFNMNGVESEILLGVLVVSVNGVYPDRSPIVDLIGAIRTLELRMIGTVEGFISRCSNLKLRLQKTRLHQTVWCVVSSCHISISYIISKNNIYSMQTQVLYSSLQMIQ